MRLRSCRALFTALAVLGIGQGTALRGAGAEAAAWRALPLGAGETIDANWVQIGWGGFVIEDGALRTKPDPRGLGLLVYRRERLGDCQIRVVFKTQEAKSNAGVYVRLTDGVFDQAGRPGAAFDRNAAGKISKPSMEAMKVSAEREEGAWFAVHHGYEVQIMDTGDAWHRTGAIYSLAASTAKPGRTGAWRTMIITLAGERITVELDGEKATDFDPRGPAVPPRKTWTEPKREPARPVRGYLGLQNHDPGDIVWFKEVSVRPLPAAAK
ncbi:MAG: DUF1080 domain-containing protein [Verrucomicrobia bacterium]|nr:DUF1080 domain-containing protein [Verrucomicrobiota bacterium]